MPTGSRPTTDRTERSHMMSLRVPLSIHRKLKDRARLEHRTPHALAVLLLADAVMRPTGFLRL
jgi:glutamine synthetase